MELETYEANLADIALQEQTFYETKPTIFELQMASQLMNNQNGIPGGFSLQPIISLGGKGKKKKSVKFLTYVQVRNVWTFRRTVHRDSRWLLRPSSLEKLITNAFGNVSAANVSMIADLWRSAFLRVVSFQFHSRM